MKKTGRPFQFYISLLAASILAAAFYLISSRNYLLFHSLAEIFSIVTACAVFIIAWNSRGQEKQSAFVLLGIGYLFVAILDTLHTFSYEGMSIIVRQGDYPTKLWISARYLQSVALLLFAWVSRTRRTINYAATFTGFAGITILLVLSIFLWDIFPLCFEEGIGTTVFKNVSEYLISTILLAGAIIVARSKTAFAPSTRRLLIASIVVAICSEMSFIVYISGDGFFYFFGHLLKIGSYFLMYLAVIAGEVQRKIRAIEELTSARESIIESDKSLLRANSAKDKFISILAHDLRNPFASVLTLTELITKRFDQLTPEEIRHQCELANESVSRGMDLLDHLLSWGKAQSGRVEWQPILFNLRGLSQIDIEFVSGMAAEKNIHITNTIDDTLAVYADPNMISKILRNFISNAIKFTPEGGTIKLSADTDGYFLTAKVRDTGVGMNADRIGRLFQIDTHFTTPGTKGEQGSGLGLLLCKELAERNGGEISVVSNPENGSTFSITIPVRPLGNAPRKSREDE
ncbi:MAG: hypothetical protein HN368_18890 [Spirochaetales bacterium]|nr:hypothetical protein [Spirochaetales bacterium]